MKAMFSGRSRPPALPKDQAERQGRISFAVLKALGRERAIPFLNTHHDALGGRPLEIATLSEDGLRRVEELIAQESAPPPSA